VIAADSLTDLKRGLVLTDVTAIKPNSRMVIFDACYNGDFREPDNIASRYIFADGKTVVTFANSVNVLQDKQANELLGLLWLGSRIGQWAQETNILESHIIGDPTFRFTPSAEGVDGAALCSEKYNEAAQLALVKNSPYLDVRNAAMHRLWRNGSKELSPLLFNVFKTSQVAMERYTAMSLLEKLNDDNYREVLKIAITDPNEFIRRTAANRMGRVGLDEYVPYLVKAYYDDNLSARVAFNIEMVIAGFSPEAIRSALAGKDDELSARLLKVIPSRAENDSIIIDKGEKLRWRVLFINSLRNNNVHASLPSYLSLLDADDNEEVKLAMLDALAWYDKSYRRGEIMDKCQEIMKSSKASKAIKAAAKRTYYRLK
jgi:HEAT repeat protein